MFACGKVCLALLGTAIATLAGATPSGGAPAHGSVWTGSWSTAPTAAGDSSGFTDQTLREIVHTSVGGDRIRLRLTNAFGTTPLVLDDVAVGLRAAGATVLAGTNRPVTFDGRRRVVVPPGTETFSDPVLLRTEPGHDLGDPPAYVDHRHG